MPNQADMIVKKNDGTTDITYSAVAASAGDGSPAIWRSNSVGASVAARPEVRMTSRANGTASARRVESQMSYPETITGSDSIPRVVNRLNVTLTVLRPNGMSDAVADEGVSQFLNVCAHTLFKSSAKAGFAPT